MARGPLTRQRLLVAAGLAFNGDARAVWQRLRLLRRGPVRRTSAQRSFAGLLSRTASSGRDPSRATILLGMPFVIGGGADRVLSAAAGALVASGHRVLAVTTRSTPFGYHDRGEWFSRAGVELVDLPALLPERDWLDFIDWLIDEEGVDVLWQTGSDYLYRTLEELRRHHPDLRIVDSLFNTEVHIRRHLALRHLIDVAVVETELVEDALIAGGADPARLVRIPNGVDTSHFHAHHQLGHPEMGDEPEVLNVGFVGRLAAEKGPLAFVDVASACRGLPMRFHVAGDGPLAGATKRRARRRGLDGSFVRHGFLEDIRGLYRRLDAVVVPSRSDGRPNVVLEALAMGVPVLVSPVGALPQLVTDGVNGFVCAGVPAFAERLQWLQSHPPEHRAIREAARVAAVRDLDVTATHERYERVIDELVDARSKYSSHA